MTVSDGGGDINNLLAQCTIRGSFAEIIIRTPIMELVFHFVFVGIVIVNISVSVGPLPLARKQRTAWTSVYTGQCNPSTQYISARMTPKDGARLENRR